LEIDKLIRLIKTLRGENGCPWDKKQTPETIAGYLIEEVYELVDAIESENPDKICEELGDVLFQVVFIAFLFEEMGQFKIDDVVRRNYEKMVRRHPHVFGNAKIADADEVRKKWRTLKMQENNSNQKESMLDSVPAGLPALMRAYRISERAAGAGFDWNDISGVVKKAQEEWSEFKAELAGDNNGKINRERASLEFGDILFTLVNVARFAELHPETALRKSTNKFAKRFKHMESILSERGQTIESISAKEMDTLWEQAKMETSWGDSREG